MSSTEMSRVQRVDGTAAFLRWARTACVPLDLDAPGDPGIAALADVWRDVPVLGLGEATHGTSEFFTFKARIVEALAYAGRRPALAFEAGVAETEGVAEAVGSGTGAATAVSGIRFWTWDTVEVQELVGDLARARAAGHDVPVIGIDPQFGASTARALAAVLPEAVGTPGIRDLADDFVAEHLRALSGPVPERALACGRALVDAAALAADRRTSRLTAALDAWLDMVPRPVADDRRRVRDQAMAQAVVGLSGQHSPVMVWAHNAHVAIDGFDGRLASLGGHLRTALGEGYVSVGLSFGSGGFQAMDESEHLTDHHLEAAPHSTWDAMLDELDHEVLALPLHAAPDDVRAWLRDARPGTRWVGAGYFGEGFTWWRPHVEDFDWIVHVRRTSAARRTPTAVRLPQQRTESLSHPVDLTTQHRRDVAADGWHVPSSRRLGHHVLASIDGSVIVQRDDDAHDFGYGLLVQDVRPGSLAGRTVEVVAEVDAPAPTVGCTVRAMAEAWDASGERTLAVSEAHSMTGPNTLAVRLRLPVTVDRFRYGLVVTGTEPVVVRTIRCRASEES